MVYWSWLLSRTGSCPWRKTSVSNRGEREVLWALRWSPWFSSCSYLKCAFVFRGRDFLTCNKHFKRSQIIKVILICVLIIILYYNIDLQLSYNINENFYLLNIDAPFKKYTVYFWYRETSINVKITRGKYWRYLVYWNIGDPHRSPFSGRFYSLSIGSSESIVATASAAYNCFCQVSRDWRRRTNKGFFLFIVTLPLFSVW